MRPSLLAACLLVVAGYPAERTVRASAAVPLDDAPGLILEREGLGVVLEGSDRVRLLTFGTRQTRTTHVVVMMLGSEPIDQGRATDCRASYARWAEGLTVWFVRGSFAGWSVDRSGPLVTADGWGVGSTRAEVEAVTDPIIAPSTLGVEFSVGGIAGLFESESRRARVTQLWAGRTCISR